MSKKIDLKGQRFGRLVVIEQDLTSKRTKWICKCDCGNTKSVQATHLRSGATQSCGCYHKEKAREANISHGLTKTSLHNRWKAIKQRCENVNDRKYRDYGARGITICEEWRSFENFLQWSLENGYSEELELDRIDNDKGYYPDNCRWCKTIVNNHNRRITAKIEGLPLKDFATKYSMSYSLVHSRYYELKRKGLEINTYNILTYANQLPLNRETY